MRMMCGGVFQPSGGLTHNPHDRRTGLAIRLSFICAVNSSPLNSGVIPPLNMKYRILKSIGHNFSHSFVSYMNYVDDGHVVDDLRQLARQANGERISIHWIPDSERQALLPERVLKSIASYKAWLPGLVSSSGASVEMIVEFRTDIFLKRSRQIAVEAYLLDDRGKEHVCNVRF